MPYEDAGDAYMNHAGGGMYGTGRLNTNRTNDDKVVHHARSEPFVTAEMTGEERRETLGKSTNKIADEAAEAPGAFTQRSEFIAELISGMDDAGLRGYLKRQYPRVSGLERELEIARAVLREMEREADKRGLNG